MGEYLKLTPAELKFRFELRKNIPVTLSLHNPGSEKIAFKVKTTSPKKYCVRPSSGVVEPGATKDVQVIMQAQKEYPPPMNDSKDKFLVQSIKVKGDVTEVTQDLFEAAPGKEIKQSKLRVVFVGPPKPPSPVPEGVEEEHSPSKHVFKENGPSETEASQPDAHTSSGGEGPNSDLAKVTRERNRLRDQLAKVESDKAEFKKRLDLVEAHNTKGVLQAQKAAGGGRFTVLHLIVAVLIAFFIGYLFPSTSSQQA